VKPSGKRPPYGVLPRGLATGPKRVRPVEGRKVEPRLTVNEIVSHEVELATRRLDLILHVLAVPCHRQGVPHRESGNVILVVDTSKPILVLERRPGEFATVDIFTSDERHFLSSTELRRERFCFLVSSLVDPKVDCGPISFLLISQNDQYTHHFQKIEEMEKSSWRLQQLPRSGSKQRWSS
jgi:hypothetical protein